MKLIEEAKNIKNNSYSPYSNFKVGSALLTSDNIIYTGCNIENSSYTPSCCAERVTIYKAISEGKTDFKEIAIVGDKNPCYPCGVCLQVMSEFCSEEFKIYLLDNDQIREYTLKELLPLSFRLEQ